MEKLRVLIVDDEPGMRRGALKSLLRYEVFLPEVDREVGFDLDDSPDGGSTLEKLEKNDYDLVLLDYKLPDISGLEILQSLRERDCDLLTIMMTAYASLDVAVSATKNGAFDFLAKPFTPSELRATVKKAAANLLLQRRARELEESQRQVRFEFLSVLAHELKAPLNAVEGYLKIMEEHTLGDSIVDYDRMIGRSLVRVDGMRKLIFDLLDLTRIESGQKSREVCLVDVRESASKALETFQAQAAERNIKLKLHTKESLMMHGDSSELEIIFNNLVSNAVKYNRDGGAVDVILARTDEGVEITVSDTGIGMSAEQVDKLFREFVRFKNPKAGNVEGSGLGLSILKRLSRLYNGDVKVESKEGVGTSFTVTLRDQEEGEMPPKEGNCAPEGQPT